MSDAFADNPGTFHVVYTLEGKSVSWGNRDVHLVENREGRHGSFRANFFHLPQMSKRLDILFVSAVG